MEVKYKYTRICEHLTLAVIIIIAIGIPCSNILMSIGGIALAVLFLISPKLLIRAKYVFREPFAMFALALFAWHIIGLLWTTDMGEGIRDIRIKLPILLFPIALSGIFSISTKKRLWIIRIYLLTVLTNTIILFGVSQHWYGPEINNFRDVSLFISHIRLSLNICLAVGLLWLYPAIIINSVASIVLKFILTLWALYFLSILESGTSILISCTIGLIAFLYIIHTKIKVGFRVISYLSLLLIIIISSLGVHSFYNSIFTPLHDFHADKQGFSVKNKPHHSLQVENGYYVHQYINEKELTKQWELRTNSSIHKINDAGYETKETLLRYLASKGLTKDSIGLSKLSDSELVHVQQGETNYRFIASNGFIKRLYKIMFEWNQYKLGQSPNGHSLIMRFEFVKTGIHILKNNWVLGVGTGDLKSAFNSAYTDLESQLSPKWRHRAHNQYLSIWLALGLVGFILFLGIVCYPFYIQKTIPLYVWLFVIIALISMLTEDTLETQAGATFVMFFMSFFFLSGVQKITS